MRWRILDGPHQKNPNGIDGELWIATIENVNDPAQRRLVGIILSRTALQSSNLPSPVPELLADGGRLALERFLDEVEPPKRISVTTVGVLVVEH